MQVAGPYCLVGEVSSQHLVFWQTLVEQALGHGVGNQGHAYFVDDIGNGKGNVNPVIINGRQGSSNVPKGVGAVMDIAL